MGLTGAGGGMLAVPAWFSQGVEHATSVPVALLAVSSGALIGAIDGLTSWSSSIQGCDTDGNRWCPMTLGCGWPGYVTKTLMLVFSVC